MARSKSFFHRISLQQIWRELLWWTKREPNGLQLMVWFKLSINYLLVKSRWPVQDTCARNLFVPCPTGCLNKSMYVRRHHHPLITLWCTGRMEVSNSLHDSLCLQRLCITYHQYCGEQATADYVATCKRVSHLPLLTWSTNYSPYPAVMPSPQREMESTWSTESSLRNKLHGRVTDLRMTVRFIALTGL